MATEADTVVYNYLLSTTAKLAAKFKKQRQQSALWNGPGLVELIAFYKANFQKTPEHTLNGNSTISSSTLKVKKGKKRKLSEVDKSDDVTMVTIAPTEPVTIVTIPDDNSKPASKKKTKKKKKKSLGNGTISPDVLEIIQDTKVEESVPVPDAPTGTPTDTQADTPADTPTPTRTPGGMVGDVSPDPVEEPAKKKSKKVKRGSQSSSSFRRVKEEDVIIEKKELADNTFEAKGGADDFGFKAHQVFKFTKGKSFRHEKTKKKRGTYKGGVINMGVTSIKFDSD